MLNVSPTIILEELEGIASINKKWIERIKEGIPTLTFQAKDEDFELYMKQLIGELRILAGKADNLADVLAGIR